MFSTWEVNLLLYLISVVVFTQFYKLSMRTVRRDGAATILLQLIAGITVLMLVPFFSLTFPNELKLFGLLALACVFYALHDRMQTSTRKNLPVGEIAIISQLTNVFIIIFGFTIFQEDFQILKAAGAILIILGNILIIYRKGKFKLNKYLILAIIATLIFAIALSIDVGISSEFNLPIYISITLLVPAVMILISERIGVKEVANEYKIGNKFYFLATGISWACLIFFLLRAYKFGDVTTVAPLAALNVLLNVLVAFVVHKETERKLTKVIAALVIILGIYLTVVR